MAGIVDVVSGKLMVVSDIHGNGYDFFHILKKFKEFKRQGLVDKLVFLGDLIHSFNYKKDQSFEILNELMGLKANEKDSDYFCLLGNHEWVHLFHVALQKGRWEFNKGLEWKIAKQRKQFVSFFQAMPLAIRTSSGVLLHHTGASSLYCQGGLVARGLFPDFLKEMEVEKLIEPCIEGSYDDSIKKYDPDIGDRFMKLETGKVWWEALFNGNEFQYDAAYSGYIADFLSYMSGEGFELRFLVTGHIGVDYGAEIVGGKQIRICSSSGCPFDLEKKLLVLDAAKPYYSIEALYACVEDVY